MRHRHLLLAVEPERLLVLKHNDLADLGVVLLPDRDEAGREAVVELGAGCVEGGLSEGVVQRVERELDYV